MDFQDVEKFLVGEIAKRLKAAQTSDPATFHAMFKDAYEPLRNFGVNTDYSLPLIGEAYALKYHLQRMDNLNVALDRVHLIHPLLSSAKNVVLDVGSGTGASTMGLLRWLALNSDPQRQQVKIVSGEPYNPMRNVAKQLIPAFTESLNLSGVTSKFTSRNLNSCAATLSAKTSPILDLVTFCYTFWIQEQWEWKQTTDDVLQVASFIKPGGVLLFLTPNQKDIEEPDYAKVLFMNHLRGVLQQKGWHSIGVTSPSGFDPDKSTTAVRRLPVAQRWRGYDAKYPHLVAQVIALSLQSPPLQGDDRPYYAFSATIDAFTR